MLEPDHASNVIESVPKEKVPEQLSYFNGTTLQLIGWRLLGILLSAITLGIGAPWAQCMIYRWETKHTYINGKQLYFDGRGHQLLGKYLLWGLLTLITVGIYAVFIPVRMHKWRVSHTRFAVPSDLGTDEPSGAVIFGFILAGIAVVIATVLILLVLIPKFGNTSNKLDWSILEKYKDRFDDEVNDDPAEDFEDRFVLDQDINSYIIDNGDGTFSVIYGDLPTDEQIDSELPQETTSPENSELQNEYDFTDDPRIIGSWLMRAVLMIDGSPSELEAAELSLKDDGTFSYFKDLFSGGSSGWHPDGIGESRSNGRYTFKDGVLTLYYGSYFVEEYSSEPGYWKTTDKVVVQQITFTENEYAIYFSSFGDVMGYNGYFEPIEYCPRIVSSIEDTLEAIYPNGLN